MFLLLSGIKLTKIGVLLFQDLNNDKLGIELQCHCYWILESAVERILMFSLLHFHGPWNKRLEDWRCRNIGITFGSTTFQRFCRGDVVNWKAFTENCIFQIVAGEYLFHHESPASTSLRRYPASIPTIRQCESRLWSRARLLGMCASVPI